MSAHDGRNDGADDGARDGARDGAHDSAGVPWGGRRLPATGFAGDDGAADPALLSLLARRVGDPPSAGLDRDLVAAAAAARWIVPVVAAPGETAVGEHGLDVDTSTDMAVVTLVGPDGRRALPVFTSVAALATYDPGARPVPVAADVAARAAVAEGADVLVVDLGSDHAVELRGSMLWALAQRAAWLPAHDDPFVTRAVDAAVADELRVVRTRLEDGDPAGAGVLRVVLALEDGLDAAAVEALATRVGERLATDGELRARVDGLAFALERA